MPKALTIMRADLTATDLRQAAACSNDANAAYARRSRQALRHGPTDIARPVIRYNANMALTDLEISHREARRAPRKTVGRRWPAIMDHAGRRKARRLAYRFAGGQKTLAINVYPETGLREARAARDEAKRLLPGGKDPSLAERLAKAAKATASANTSAQSRGNSWLRNGVRRKARAL